MSDSLFPVEAKPLATAERAKLSVPSAASSIRYYLFLAWSPYLDSGWSLQAVCTSYYDALQVVGGQSGQVRAVERDAFCAEWLRGLHPQPLGIPCAN
jgi:hypothetical protein